jgi:ElaB/YqjD/DUF883 family membrane-anchored ribosome-binding protein
MDTETGMTQRNRGNDVSAPNQPSGGTGKLTEDAVKAAKGLAQSVTTQASTLVSNVGHELTATAEANVTNGAEALRGFAKAMQTAAEELDSRSPQVARRIRDAADQVETFSDTISNRSMRELFDAASDLARSRPTAFIAGAVVAGFALGRFIKSSAPEQNSGEKTGPDSGFSGQNSWQGEDRHDTR